MCSRIPPAKYLADNFDRDADDDAKYIKNYVDEDAAAAADDDDKGVIIQGCPGQTDPWAKGRAGL